MIHQFGDPDFIGAAGGTGPTGRTDPEGPASEDPFSFSQDDQADDLVGHKVHGEGQWTAVGAFSALKTGQGPKRPGLFQGIQVLRIKEVRVHGLLLYLIRSMKDWTAL
jgi:hypothetical protein